MERNLELFNMEDKVAVITGAYTGLGYDMASALAQAGCNIIITSREIKKAQEAAEKLSKDYDVDTLGIQLDQRFFEQVKDMAEKAYQWKGHIDVLINNAGGGSGTSEGNFLKRPPEDVKNLIDINLTGALFCCREVGRFMVDQGYGKIINIGSIAGMIGRDRDMYHQINANEQPVDYAAAKAGVIGMTRDVAAFMAPYGVTANCISPGGFNTRNFGDDFLNAFGSRTAIGRMGKMGDLQGAALYLASAASDYMTGHNMVVDGGFVIWK